MHEILKENIAKNLIILIVLGILCFQIPNCIGCSVIEEDKAAAGSLLTTISLISVIACFGCFAFTYEKVQMKKRMYRYLAHITTGLLMLAIGTTLILTSLVTKIIAGPLLIIDLLLVMVYLACVCYDFWDILRTEKFK